MPYDFAGRQEAIAAFSRADADVLGRYDAAIEQAADVLRDLVLRTPPNAGGGIAGIVRGMPLGLRLSRLGTGQQQTLVELFTKSAAEFLGGYFEHDFIKGAFAFDGIVGAYASPFMPGTAYVLLHHCFGEVNGQPGRWGHALGGMGAISRAIAAAAEAAGAEIRTGACVRRIDVADGRVGAVHLEGGERISARAVAVGLAPKLLFRDLIAADAIPAEVRRRFLSIRSGSGTFRMNVALSGLPTFSGRPAGGDHLGAGIVIGPGLAYLEAAWLDARREGWSREPVVEMLIPSTLDPSLAPAGQHVASLFVQQVAPHLPDGRAWADSAEKERFADHVIDTVTTYAPDFVAKVVARQVLSPLDLEQRFGLVDGDIFHGQLGLDQMFSTRPVLGYANYRLPVQGLYLAGSGAHPGGGVTGVPGHNAAREIRRDLRARRWWGA
jgi:phytoene dehydrogenase-like protein